MRSSWPNLGFLWGLHFRSWSEGCPSQRRWTLNKLELQIFWRQQVPSILCCLGWMVSVLHPIQVFCLSREGERWSTRKMNSTQSADMRRGTEIGKASYFKYWLLYVGRLLLHYRLKQNNPFRKTSHANLLYQRYISAQYHPGGLVIIARSCKRNKTKQNRVPPRWLGKERVDQETNWYPC